MFDSLHYNFEKPKFSKGDDELLREYEVLHHGQKRWRTRLSGLGKPLALHATSLVDVSQVSSLRPSFLLDC